MRSQYCSLSCGNPRFARSISLLGRALVVLAVLLGTLLMPGQALSATYYVKTSGSDTNSGENWGLAKKTVQAAINTAASGDSIWVAAGTYQERVTLKSGELLYGGFLDGDTDISQRNWVNNATTIDAVLVGVAVTVPASADPSTTIDGFVIRNGKGTNGAGILCNQSALTVANCDIRNNAATSNGGGLYCKSSTLSVTNTTFSSNSGSYSGGLYCEASSPTISGCTFTSNSAAHGGAIFLSSSPASITNCTFGTNTATSNGGGIYAESSSSPTISGCTFTGNTAGNGGGVYCYNSSPAITQSSFSGNRGSSGGGVYLVYGAGTVSGNTFTGNSADVDNGTGGGIYLNSNSATVAGNKISGCVAFNSAGMGCNSGSPTLYSNTLYANVATNIGGGIGLSSVSNAKCVNNTIVDNFAGNGGGGIYTYNSGSLSVHNNIVVFNVSGIKVDGTVPSLKYNCVYGNDTLPYTGITDPTGSDGNIAVDPELANYLAGDLHIQLTSPCKEAGDGLVVVAGWKDMDDQDRVQGTVDIGADESNGDVWTGPAAAKVIYVSSTNGADWATGLSWTEAKRTIQAGIDVALPGDEVWVMAGDTYVETITLKKRVGVYGGFNGTETLRSERNWTTNTTTIDANLTGTVVKVPSGAFGGTALDGFTVRNGQANSSTSNNGGGVYCVRASLNLANCTFRNNTATNGAGVYLNYSPSVLSANAFRFCIASSYGGGVYCKNAPSSISGTLFVSGSASYGAGIYLEQSSSQISTCTFTSGGASHGGAIFMSSGAASIASCTFTSNIASSNGGAVYCESWTGAITASTFTTNSAGNGGGLYLYSGSGTVSGSTFNGNTVSAASGAGGGIYSLYGSPIIHTNVFADNRAFVGAALYCNSSTPSLYNNTMRANTATNVGGGIYLTSTANAKCVNNTIVDNFAANGGAGIYTNNCGTATVHNNIVAFNASGIRVDGAVPTLRYNCVFGNDAIPYMGIVNQTGLNGNIATDPVLANPSGGDLHIQPGSPCINTGDDTVVLTVWKDMDNQDRVQGARVDIGADESNGTLWAGPPASKIIRVRTTGNDANSGLTWPLAKKTIQAAINAASPGDEIWVATGTYLERITAKKRVAVYGGFAGTINETLRTHRNWTTNLTTINANLTGTAITIPVGCFASTTFDGFTIRNGQASSATENNGGGLYCVSASVNLANCTLRNNSATNGAGAYFDYSPSILTGNEFRTCAASSNGGGVFVGNAPATISGSLFATNTASYGAGIYFTASSGTISGCTFSSNTSSYGGGVMLSSGAPTLASCTFSDNTATHGGGFFISGTSGPLTGNTVTGNISLNNGGGVYMESHSGTFSGNSIRGNTAGNSGGGLYVYSGSPTIYSNTIAENRSLNGAGIFCQYGSSSVFDNMVRANTATNTGGGVTMANMSSAKCVNNTIADNFAANGGAGIHCNAVTTTPVHNNIVTFNASGIRVDGTAPTLKYNCVFGNDALPYMGIVDQTGTNGNIAVDPKLANVSGGDLHIQPDSECIDKGDEAAVLTIMKDFDGQDRILGLTVDIGADESNGATWAGPPASKVLYVSTAAGNDGNDGLSWPSAKKTIQAAIDAASAGDEVWVERGQYAGPITLKKRVGVFGGFVGNESVRDARNWLANQTVLDGGNLSTVVNVAVGAFASTALDGFTVTRGNTAGNGGGMSCSVASVQTANNTFQGNRAVNGGAIFFDYSPSVLTNNTVQGNTATSYGGGIYSSNAPPSLTDVIIRNNTAGYGAGIYLNNSSALVQSCVVTSNAATSQGGGAYVTGGNPAVTGGIFAGNSANYGGGLFVGTGSVTDAMIAGNTATYGAGIYLSSTGIVSKNTITGNTALAANGSGGAIYAEGATTVHTNMISGNRATRGGGIFCQYGSPKMYNNVFQGNESSSKGGAVWFDASSSVVLVNNTIAGNNAATGGAGLYFRSIGSTSVANNTVAFNQSGVLLEGGSLLPKNNNVFGNTSYQYSGISDQTGTRGNISVDPEFADLASGNFHIQPTSDCLDAGDDDAVVTILTDMDGEDRIAGLRVDIGADESDGTSWPGSGSANIGIVKSAYPDGDAVSAGALSVTGSFPDLGFTYAERIDRSAGIRILSYETYLPGELIGAVGIIQTDTVTGERYVLPDGTWPRRTGGYMLLGPVGLDLGGVGGGAFGLQPGIPGSVGLNNIGLLITTWGTVTEIESSLIPTWFVIQGASGATAKVMLPTGVPVPVAIGDMVSVIGISTCEEPGTGLSRLILTRTADDISRYY